MASASASLLELRNETIAVLEPLCENWLFEAPADKENNIDGHQSGSDASAAKKVEAKANCNLTTAFSELDLNDENSVRLCSTSTNAHKLAEMQRCAKEIEQCAERVRAVGDRINQIRQNYDAVAVKTSSLHHDCDQLMSDQTRLAGVAEEIRCRLAYYEPVDNIMQKLNSPHLSVTSEAFTRLLASIDECMLFLSQQGDYKEADAYKHKYQQCLSRALSLVKSFVAQKLQESVDTIQKQLQEGDATRDAEDVFTLYYGVFATHAQTVKSLMQGIEAKCASADEYASVVVDCYSLYFQHRDTLMRPSVQATVSQLMKAHASSTCALTRNGCSAMLRVCDDEYRLFYQFFTRHTELLHDFAERLCLLLYDALRPTIIHIPHLETLAEVCTIIKVEMVENRCSDTDVIEEYIGFVRVANALAGDISERLVYRALMYAQTDIAQYRPAAGDLAYPQKLIMMQEIASSTNKAKDKDNTESTSSDTDSQKRTISAVDLHALWYPTVRRTILCLSKIYKCLHETVFVGVSQEVLGLCLQSLLYAAEQIALADSKRTLDAQLFLIKHLLILREQTSPFRVSAVEPMKDASMDFGKFKDSARSLLAEKSRWFSLSSNNSLLEFMFQAPVNILEHASDGRRGVDLQLRESCQKFIVYCTHVVVGDMNEFVRKAEVVIELAKQQQQQPTDSANAAGQASSKAAACTLRSQPFAQAQQVHDMVATAFRSLRQFIPQLQQSLRLYIASVDTENILMQPIKKRIFESFAQLRFIVTTEYTQEDQQIIAMPNNEQLNLTFAAKQQQQE